MLKSKKSLKHNGCCIIHFFYHFFDLNLISACLIQIPIRSGSPKTRDRRHHGQFGMTTEHEIIKWTYAEKTIRFMI